MTRVLVIEDDAHSLSGLIEILSTEGYEVYGALNSVEAKNIIISRSIDIVICDYCLPDTTGLEFCPILRDYQPSVKIFLITALYDRKIFDIARKNGIEEILSKPIVIDDLLQKIKHHSMQ
ncbi:response regulator [candidate division KSB1 bacterium]|nr:response regulator [candidate division KSB1 bacterium]